MSTNTRRPTSFDPGISREKRQVIRAAIKLIKKRMTGKNPQISTGELIRVMETEDGMEPEEPRIMEIRWTSVDEDDPQDERKP